MIEALARAIPSMDVWLAKFFDNTALLKGGVEDYILAIAIAVAFPLIRFSLERSIYDVSSFRHRCKTLAREERCSVLYKNMHLSWLVKILFTPSLSACVQWIGRRALGLPHSTKPDSDTKKADLERLRKFKESLYKFGVQILFTITLIAVAVPRPWFTDTKLYWSHCSRLPCETQPSLAERLVYCLELGFYLQGIPGVFLWETKRKDRWELFAHHVATVILIGYSYFLGLTRVGVMVLVCHEANDIFLEAAKMSRYANARDFFTTSLFVLFMFSWFLTRIYVFGFVVIRSTLFESYERAAVVNANIDPHAFILNGFLIFLYVLHIYWSYLIIRVAVRQLTTGRADDIREDEEEEEAEKTEEQEEVTALEERHRSGLRRRPVGPRVLNPTGAASVGDLPSEM